MNADEIRPLIKRDKNFRPFRVTLDDGRTYDIKDPWLVMGAGDLFIIGIPMPEDPTSGIADHFEQTEWSRITKVEFLESAVSA